MRRAAPSLSTCKPRMDFKCLVIVFVTSFVSFAAFTLSTRDFVDMYVINTKEKNYLYKKHRNIREKIKEMKGGKTNKQ